MRKLIFLDRDGVLNKNIQEGYVLHVSQFEWLSLALEGLRRLNQPDNVICIVTNQAAVHKGLLKESELHQIHSFILEAVEREKGRIDEIYYCPHTQDEQCSCRKPRSGLLLRGLNQFKNCEQLWMIGDSLDDMRAGKDVGCATILVESPRTLKELSKDPTLIKHADYYVKSLYEASEIIEK